MKDTTSPAITQRDPRFYTASNRLTPYALACGYVETIEHKGHTLTLWQDGGCIGYHVRQHDHNTGKRIFWDCPHTLSQARKRFDLAKRAILAL